MNLLYCYLILQYEYIPQTWRLQGPQWQQIGPKSWYHYHLSVAHFHMLVSFGLSPAPVYKCSRRLMELHVDQIVLPVVH